MILSTARLGWAEVLSAGDVERYQAAFRAADAGDWADALAAAESADNPVLVDVILGRHLAGDHSDPSFEEIAGFVARRPGWPDLDRLLMRGEAALAAGAADAAPQIIAYFDSFPPQTGNGLLALADALAATGAAAQAADLVAERWVDIPLSSSAQAALLARHGSRLDAERHRQRLDRMLWEGRDGEATALLDLVGAGWRALAEARRSLVRRTAGVDGAIAAVPAALQDNEGLVYERLRWRRRADLTDGAIELLAAEPPGSLNGARWWAERHILARRLFESGDIAGAYRVASGHGLTDGFALAQAEWFSGWLALRFLGQPDEAFDHFQRLYDGVASPISLARGAYWSARALEAMGDRPTALGWYQRAAQQPTTFYGQLAADHLDLPTITALPSEPLIDEAARTAFEAAYGQRIVRALVAIGEAGWADRFLIAMAEATDDPAQFALIGRLALDTGRAWAAIRVAKTAARLGHTLIEAGYPLIALDAADPRAEPALVLALIRQESEFREDAVSHAGARGLMQLMPATARAVAQQIGIAHSTDQLTQEPAHNIRLGSTFLADQVRASGGSYVLALAGYNAGPGRVSRWIEERGDPRSAGVDMIDWIEAIPIYETRNYVQRVLEGVEVYRRRQGGSPTVDALERDLGL